jgi:RimJ/RimL family protein N-acetyltransferase
VERYVPELPLTTERLVLRVFRPEDLGWFNELRALPEVVRWLYEPPLGEEEALAALERRLDFTSIAGDGDGLALVLQHAETGEIVGDCGLTLVSEEHRLGEIGFVLDPEHQGHGYATEAARELLRVAFGELRLHRVIGRCEPRNTASAAVLERLGMRLEAHLVENEWVKDEWQSELVYALLDREWSSAA